MDENEDIYSRLFNEYCINCDVKNGCFFYKKYLDDIIDMSIDCEKIGELGYEMKLDDEE